MQSIARTAMRTAGSPPPDRPLAAAAVDRQPAPPDRSLAAATPAAAAVDHRPAPLHRYLAPTAASDHQPAPPAAAVDHRPAPVDRYLAPAAASDHQPAPRYRTRNVDFLGRLTPIIYQPPPAESASSSAAGNGPCALVAICNVLLLKNAIRLNLEESEVSQEKLLGLIADRLLIESKETKDDTRKQKMIDAIQLLPRIAKGLDINLKFSRIDDFEITPELGIFDLLGIQLYHGLILDRETDRVADIIWSSSYDDLASALAEFKSLKSKEEIECVEEQVPNFAGAKTDGRSLSQTSECYEWWLIEKFLLTNHGLTDFGYSSLQELEEGKICVLFRNNHFNTMIKHNKELYLLATAEDMITHQKDLVWQKFDGVKGDGVFLTSSFTPLKADDQISFEQEFERQSQTEKKVEEGAELNIPSSLIMFPPLARSKEKKIYSLPVHLYCILRPHQKDGLKWHWGIHCKDILGGIVTDDMGLGKTLQTTVFLSGLFHSDIIERALIIAPVSILPSWIDALTRSGLIRRVQEHHISGDKGLSIILETGGIFVTSYEMYHKNVKKFLKKRWDYLVLDEAHKIKTVESRIREGLEELKCRKKILLTGTPIQRDMMDMFSLMDFIQEGVLGPKDTFEKKYMNLFKHGQYLNSSLTDKEDYFRALVRLRRKVSPYMLRRTKSLLIESGDIPCNKHEVIIWLNLTHEQATLYTELCKLYNSISDHQLGTEKTLPELMLARHICNDPSLVLDIRDGKFGDSLRHMVEKILPTTGFKETKFRMTDSSCKLSFITYLIKELFRQDKIDEELFVKQNPESVGKWKILKILIFSYHLPVLHRIKEALDVFLTGSDIIQIDGNVPKEQRKKLIEKFSENGGPRIFLLSSKVGGEGLNLTAATRVIIFDSSWNLSDDNQISDRAYRFGQNKDVIVYRLFTSQTIEEHMYKKQLVKGYLAHALIDGKFCCSLVKKEDHRVLYVPKGGFNVSLIQQMIKSRLGDSFQIDPKHRRFLESHTFVSALTNQNLIFSKTQKDLDEATDDEDESDDELAIAPKISEATNWRHRLRNRSVTNNEATLEEMDANIGTSEHLEIPTYKVCALIGPNKDTIKQIGQKSLTRIEVLPSESSGSPFTAVVINGRPRARAKAKQMINELLSKQNKDYVSVPDNLIGLVIGKNRATLTNVENNTCTKIRLIGNENKFEITGTHKGIDDAKAEILAKIHKVSRSRCDRSSVLRQAGNCQLPMHPKKQLPEPNEVTPQRAQSSPGYRISERKPTVSDSLRPAASSYGARPHPVNGGEVSRRPPPWSYHGTKPPAPVHAPPHWFSAPESYYGARPPPPVQALPNDHPPAPGSYWARSPALVHGMLNQGHPHGAWQPPPIQGPPCGSWHPRGGVNEGLPPLPGYIMLLPRQPPSRPQPPYWQRPC